MRRVTAGLLAGLLVLALSWTAVPTPAAAASSDPKVVLVVGATHGTTSTYRSWMNVVAAAAAKYTKNLVKVYSPNATWSKVRSAMQGASIVVYMGHGNGFPSPYSTTLNVYSQNGMGLNKVAGEGDSNTKYYGEKYIADEVSLAPNAVVILSHLCYASGNSEPGKAEPSLSVAKARMDNFAAGFLRAGARAVIAEGHGDPAWYVEQLFTKRWTVEQLWRGAPSRKGNEFSFSSSRTAGYTVFADPNQKSGSSYEGYYRSLVTRRDPALTTEQVTGARYARTDAHPGWFVVPGAAEVVAPEGVALYGDPALPAEPAPALLPAGTRLRVLAAAGAAADGTAVYEVAALDESAAGFVPATGLAPRDSTPPQVWEVDAGARALSPNGDGSGDTLTIAARASEAVAWRVDITDADGNRVWSTTADGDRASVTWNALVDGNPLPDGTYTATLTATDPWGNAPAKAAVDLEVDTVEPQLEGLTTLSVAPVFTPNGDGTTDSVRVSYVASEAGSVRTTVKVAGGSTVASFTGSMPPGAGSVTWDGRTDADAFVTDGTYSVSLQPIDRAGNKGASLATTVVAYGALGYVKTSVTAFHSRDLDRYAPSTKLSWRLLAPATVTWQVVDGTGRAVITRYEDRALSAGSYAWTWNGKLPDGRFAPSGPYWSRVTATDGTATVTQSAKFQIAAFRVFLSDTTPSRGQLITAKILTTEPLRANPKLIYTQPGRSPVTLSTVRLSTSSYKVTFRLSTKGSVGPLVISIAGTDRAGGRNRAKVSFAME